MEKLTDYTFSSVSRYDWGTLLDGGIYRMTADELSTTTVGNFRNSLSAQARKRGLKTRTRVEKDGSLVLQAFVKDQFPPA